MVISARVPAKEGFRVARRNAFSVLVPLFLLSLAAFGADDDAAKPGDAVRARTRSDAESFMPQKGLGGDETGSLSPSGFEVVDVPIGMKGYEKMTCHLSVPKDLPDGARCPLVYLVHGNGGIAKELAERFAAITTERDPVFCLAVQYQMVKEDGKGWPNGPWLGTLKMMLDGSRWILDHVVEEYPIDADRVFIGAFGWGARWTCDWLTKEWAERAGEFPFRGCFFYSAAGFFRKDDIPPIAYVCIVGDKATDVKALGGVNVFEHARRYANRVLAWGLPCHFHQIPDSEHEIGDRGLQITRDSINDLGGPGAVPYPEMNPAAKAFPPEPLPFEESKDPYLREARALLLKDRWKEARARVEALVADPSIGTKQKRGVRKLGADMLRFARKELGRLDKAVEKSVRDGKQLSPHRLRRIKALAEAYADNGWATKPGYAEKVAKLEAEYPPLVRERERTEIMRKAWKAEADPERRREAGHLYEDLVLRLKEDEGLSIWPRAAEYRLSWWLDLE
jgi:acetyl esterase/lipase